MRSSLLAIAFVFVAGCTTSKTNQLTATTGNDPAPAIRKAEREFRAAWIATVANINWPSKPGLSTDEQKQEAIALLDYLKEHNFNAAILQVRPQCDALYKSDLEPWSYFLTGQQGKAPSPYYDPLEFWTEAAHDRGIELHVWLNPYRAHHVSGKEVTEHSIVKRKPELVHYLKEGYWWMDPSKQGTQDQSYNVVMDLVKRYDIDGVHFDDYFYPYPSYNKNDDFPDSTSYAEYKSGGGKLEKGDWRRESVNKFIKRVYEGIKKEKAYVKFGLSPFGIWRPGYPESIEGFDQHNVLYADARLWLNEGWIDYFTPQLYWPITRIGQSYPVLLGWWASENHKQRHLWPGISVGRDTAIASVNETLNQIMISRGMTPQSKGVVHWSISSDVKNPKLSQMMKDGVYRKPALVPASSWLDDSPPANVEAAATMKDGKYVINRTDDNKDVFRWVVYYQYGDVWNYQVMNRNDKSFEINSAITVNKQERQLKQIAVTAVDRTGNETAMKFIKQ